MRKLLLFAVCALAVFAAVPSHAECASFGSLYACEDTGPDHICSYSGLAVTGHSSCIGVDDLQLNYYYVDISGESHGFDVSGGPHQAGTYLSVGPACVGAFVSDYPDFGAGLC